MLAQDLLAARRPLDALEVVETAMEREPDDADLLLTLGVALLKSDELAWARRVLTQAVSADPEWAEPWRWLGEALLKSGDQPRAVRALTRARDLDGTDQAVAKLLKSVTRWEELTRRLCRFHERPELVDPALLLQDLLEDGRLAEAERVLDIALEDDDEDPDLLLLKSRVERQRGDLEAARDALARATQLDPSWEEAWRDLEGLLIEMGDEDAARTVAFTAHEAERDAMEAALAERVEREKALAERAARDRALADERALAEARRAAEAETAAQAAREAEEQRATDAAREAEERARTEENAAKLADDAARAKAEADRRAEEEAEAMQRQSLLARAAAEADARGRQAAKEALLRATADARAAAARRAEAERKQKADAEAAERAKAEAERTAREAEERKREEAFQRAWETAEREARERVAAARAAREAEERAARDEAEAEAQKAASEAVLGEGLRRAREAIWQQAKIEAERRIAVTESPSAEDMHTAAFARARQELEAQARIEARKVAEALHERREEAAARVREISELAATLEKARKAAEAQRVWEASSSARQAAAGRAMALAAKMADDARKRVSSLPPPTIIEDEPVFELSQVCVRPVQNHVPSECELDAMLDDLLDSLEGSDTLPGIPVPGVSDGGMGMTQAKASLRARQGAVAYRPPPTAASMFETVPGLPTGLDTLH